MTKIPKDLFKLMQGFLDIEFASSLYNEISKKVF